MREIGINLTSHVDHCFEIGHGEHGPTFYIIILNLRAVMIPRGARRDGELYNIIIVVDANAK